MATSSSRAVLPAGRAPATAVYRPLRTRHRRSRVAASVVTAAGTARDPASEPTTSRAASWKGARPSGVAARYSTRSAVCLRIPAPEASERIEGSAAGSAAATRSDAVSSSSIASAPDATSGTSASVACSSESSTRRVVAACARSGTVRNVTSATHPSVPSLPTSRCSRIFTGSSWSRNALTE